jgi:hypothetical protein
MHLTTMWVVLRIRCPGARKATVPKCDRLVGLEHHEPTEHSVAYWGGRKWFRWKAIKYTFSLPPTAKRKTEISAGLRLGALGSVGNQQPRFHGYYTNDWSLQRWVLDPPSSLVEGRDAVQNADYLGTSRRRIAYYGSTKHSVWIQVG